MCSSTSCNWPDRLGFDLIEAANAKIDRNEERYPADKVRGSAKKYNEY